MAFQDGPWSRYRQDAGAPPQAPATARRPGVIYGPPKTPDPLELERLDMSRRADARAERADQRAARPDAPAGYQFNAQGALEPIPGGPAAKPRTRPLPEGARVKLESNVGAYEAFRDSGANFSDDFAGNLLGDAENWVQGLASGLGTPGQRQWWSRFYSADQQIRNDLYGAALTATEKAAYDRTTINPRMDPKEIRTNLAERAEIVRKALGRQIGTYRANKYEPEAIDAAAGQYVADFVNPGDRTAPERLADGRAGRQMGADEQLLRGDQAAPPLANRFTPEQEAQVIQAIRDGDLGLAVKLTDQFNGPASPDPAGLSQAIDAVRRNPDARLELNYNAGDKAAAAADEEERFGDYLPQALKEREGRGAQAFISGVANIPSFGFDDEIYAGASALLGGGSYEDNLKYSRAVDEADERLHPTERLGGQVLGSLLPFSRLRSASGAPRSALSYGREGALIGAGYGVGSADPAPNANLGDAATDRATGGAAGALVGFGVGTGFGALGNRLGSRRGGPGVPPPPNRGDIGQAGRDLGIDVLPADVGGPVTKIGTMIAAATPGGAPFITRAARKAQEQAGTALSGIARKNGGTTSPAEAGEAATRGALNFRETSRAAASRQYDMAANMAGDVRVSPEKAIARLDRHIAELDEVPGGTSGLEALTKLRDDLVRRGSVTVNGIRGMRTQLRQDFIKDGLRGSDIERRALDAVEAATEDLADSLLAQGKPDAALAFRAADRRWADRVRVLDEVIMPIIGKKGEKSGEQVTQALQGASRSNNRRLGEFIDNLPAEEAGIVRGTLIEQLGKATATAQDNAGSVFSFETFLTNWNKLGNSAKNTLFRGETRKSIDQLALIASSARATNKFRNYSGTALSATGAMMGAGAVGPGLPLVIKALAAQAGAGALLSSPKVTRALTAIAKVKRPEDAAGPLARLGRIGNDPLIGKDVLGLQRQLQQAFASTPTRAAAEEERQ
jgi:hypothetical protein